MLERFPGPPFAPRRHFPNICHIFLEDCTQKKRTPQSFQHIFKKTASQCKKAGVRNSETRSSSRPCQRITEIWTASFADAQLRCVHTKGRNTSRWRHDLCTVRDEDREREKARRRYRDGPKSYLGEMTTRRRFVTIPWNFDPFDPPRTGSYDQDISTKSQDAKQWTEESRSKTGSILPEPKDTTHCYEKILAVFLYSQYPRDPWCRPSLPHRPCPARPRRLTVYTRSKIKVYSQSIHHVDTTSHN